MDGYAPIYPEAFLELIKILKLEYQTTFIQTVIWVHKMTPRVTQLHKGGLAGCDAWNKFHPDVLKALGFKPRNLINIEDIIATCMEKRLKECPRCEARCRIWNEDIVARRARVKPFSHFLSD